MTVSLVKEVRNVIAFFKAREGLPTAEDADANLRNSFVNALRVQINALPALAPADAAQLNEVLKDSPFGVEGTAKIVEAIVAKLHQLSPPGKKATKAAQALSQLLKYPWNYPAQAEWDIIMNKRKSMDKVHFLRILGIMKRVRMEYEQDCVFHWNYKLHYSTKWMGVDKSAVIVLDTKLEAERLMSLMPGGQSCNAKAKAAMPKLPSCNAKAVEADKKNIQAAMPKLPSDGSNAAPAKYNGGVIYTSQKSLSFRTLTTRGDKYSEKPCAKWKAEKPALAEWKAAYTHIDRARAGSK